MNAKQKSFTGERARAIDHLNPPDPQPATKSAAIAPDHFTREQPAPLAQAAPKPQAQSPKPKA